MARHLPSARNCTDAIDVQCQGPARCDGGIQLSKAARGRVAWIDKGFLTLCRQPSVHGVKTTLWHKNFAANLDTIGHRTVETSRQRSQCPRVLGDIFTHSAVTPSGGRR